jgi:tetratricopeptide (TPR) repeat protein
MKRIIVVSILFITLTSLTEPDSISVKSIKGELDILKNKMDEVRRDQLNYTIEKDLLKETYSNNFDRINVILTSLLGLFAILTFFGVRDINAIKKECKEELVQLQTLKNSFDFKTKELDENKRKYDEEIKLIFRQSEEQNKKIKTLEFKDKISTLFKDKQYSSALEFCVLALELSPDDISLLIEKAKIQCRIAQFDNAIETYERVIEIDKTNSTAISNLCELCLLKNNFKRADKLMAEHPSSFKDRPDFKLTEFFDLLKSYHKGDIAYMKEYAKKIFDPKNVDNQVQTKGWDFTDALGYIHLEPDTDQKRTMQVILFYLFGKLKGADLDRLLKLGLIKNDGRKE